MTNGPTLTDSSARGKKEVQKIEKKKKKKTKQKRKQKTNGSVAHMRPNCRHTHFVTSLLLASAFREVYFTI